MRDVLYGCRLLVLRALDPATGLPTGSDYTIQPAEADDGNTGSGSVTSGGAYTGDTAGRFEIQIVTANALAQTITDAEFRWRFANGAWSAPVAVTGAAQALQDGVTVTFSAGAAGQDFVVGDSWTVDVTVSGVRIETPQQAGVNPQFSEGTRQELRGGDRLLASVEDDPDLIGIDLSFNDAELNGPAMALIAGGTWNEGTEEYTAPTIGTPRTPLQAKLYVARYEEAAQNASDIAGYVEFTFNYVKGRIPSFSPQDRSFSVPNFTLNCRQNAKAGLPVFSWKRIAALPA